MSQADETNRVFKTFKKFSVDKDPANDCLDVAVITDPKLRTKKTIKKLRNIAGRFLNKWKLMELNIKQFGLIKKKKS
mgnify:CR=1 FL=1